MQLQHASYESPGEPGRRGFEDLECYKLALDVVLNAHAFAKNLPSDEKYDLAPQIRRAAKSITANIAEGYGRYHYLDNLKFLSNARGSLNETLAHLINAHVIGCCERAYFEECYALIRQTERVLNGYMTFVRKQRAGDDSVSARSLREDSENYETIE